MVAGTGIGLDATEKGTLARDFWKAGASVLLWANAAGAAVAPNIDAVYHDDVSSRVMNVQRHGSIGLQVEYTKGDETSIQVQVFGSVDGTLWLPLAGNDAIAAGVIRSRKQELSFVAADFAAGPDGNINLLSVAHVNFIKVKVKSTAGTPTGTVRVTAIGGTST